MRSTEIDNSADIIDSRDIIKRLEDLESEREDLQTPIDEAQEAYDDDEIEIENTMEQEIEEAREELGEDAGAEEVYRLARSIVLQNRKTTTKESLEDAQAALADWDNADEYKNLKALAEQCEGYGDWRYGETLIRDSYFTKYAQQLADDSGAIKDDSWPCNCIDWEQAASELQSDYTSVEFDGTTYWMRS